MLIPQLDRAGMRKLLEQIPTDADFDALCLDFFPEVHARFAASMDRVQKVTLLLQLEQDAWRIESKLRQRFPDLAMGNPPQAASPRGCSPLLAGVGAALLIAVGLLGYLLAGKSPERVAAPVTPPSLSSPSPLPPSPSPLSPSPPRSRTTVEHEGAIHANGQVNITAPAGAHETVVKTRGQIEAGGDVNIGITASAAAPSKSRSHAARP